MIRVLGIDPGTRVTGYGVVDYRDRGLSYVCGGLIRPPQKRVLSKRLYILSEELSNIIEEYRPTCMAVEGLYLALNARSAMMLGHARGVVLMNAGRFGLEVFEYSPSTVKQSITGYGRAPKEQVRGMVKRLLKSDVIDGLDVTDALAVAICHIHHLTYSGKPRPASPGSSFPL